VAGAQLPGAHNLSHLLNLTCWACKVARPMADELAACHQGVQWIESMYLSNGMKIRGAPNACKPHPNTVVTHNEVHARVRS
jgi:hypothetical protein